MAEGKHEDNDEQQQQQQQQQQQKKDNRSEDSVKLFVGQVPKHMTEEQLVSFFKEQCVTVDQVNVIKDKLTKLSRGCCFVTCPSREEADKAVLAFHKKKIIPGASSPLQVKYADGELERLEHKLFIGMLPKNASEAEVSDIFSQYGTIKELQILRGSQHKSKASCAFLKYETKDQALAAIEAVNEKITMEGSNLPLVVKWADTEKERQARKTQKFQSVVANINDPSQNALYGAMPGGYAPSYNGYGYQGPGSYRLMPYPMPPMQNAVRVVRPDISSGIAPRTYVGSSYSAVPNVRFPVHGSLPSTVQTTLGKTSPGASSSSGNQIEGPPGANLFIYQIPQEYGDPELAIAFKPFGTVLSAKVFVDKVTGVSKCFGFVSYDSPTAAQTAISTMNGFQLGGKKLKVQLKRDNKQTKPC